MLVPGERREVALEGTEAAHVVAAELVYVRNRFDPESFTTRITRAERRLAPVRRTP